MQPKTVFLKTLLIISLLPAPSLAAEPILDIKSNQSDGPVTLTSSDNVVVTVELRPGDKSGQAADWWLYAETPFGLFYYEAMDNSPGWRPGLAVTYQGPLFDLSPLEVLDMGLPAGTYLLHFAIDMTVNGEMDHKPNYRDKARIHMPKNGSASVILGRVVSLEGMPISQASVTATTDTATSDSEGWFALSAGPSSQWVTVTHADFLSRTRAAKPGNPVLFRLTADDGETISLHFAGDTMLGRRFYDPNSDGDTSDARLPVGAGVEEHLELLKPIQPLLENADITAINLETPLIEKPDFDLTQPRPPGFHPTKSYAFATDTEAALALKQAGVDVVDLGNNHLYDFLEQGVIDTQTAVAQAGLAYFGAGLNEDAAWQPVVINRRGQSIAFIGCTPISGSESEISYVASDADNKGGAAECTEARIRSTVAQAKAQHDIVIMMIHDGVEYQRTPSKRPIGLTTAAREAGATLVINHTPHVVGGFDWDGQSLVAWTLGNFMFDQTVWSTLQSYILGVHLRKGQVIQAYAEPVMIEDFIPLGLTRDLADFIAQQTVGLSSEAFLVENGSIISDLTGIASRHNTVVSVVGSPAPGTILHTPKTQWVSDFSGPGTLRLGRDLLWVGSFETENVVGPSKSVLWQLEGRDKFIGKEFAYQGAAGARLQRDAQNAQKVLLTPLYRLPIQAGTEISVTGMVRTHGEATVNLQLSWYPKMQGSSSERTIEVLEVPSQGEWQPFRLDAVAPADTIAVRLYLKLSPPKSGQATADFDNLRLIAWAPPETPFSPLYDQLRITGNGEVTFSQDILPGADEL